jgi:DNA polymerase-3 subunit beta
MKIPYKALKATGLFAPAKDIRYYFNGVLIDSTGSEVRLIATDGHTMALYRLREEAPVGRAILPIEDVKDALKIPRTASEKEHPFEVELPTKTDAGTPIISISHGNGTIQKATAIEGAFPDYLKALPRTASGEPAQFNPEHLNRFAQADRVLGGLKRGDLPHVYVHYNGDEGALVECQHDESFLGVVMPMRVNAGKPSDLTLGLPESCNE